MTYAELDAEATSQAARLAEAGVGEGDRVATTLGPGLVFVALLHALPRLGAALVPLDARLGEREIQRRVGAAGARVLSTHDSASFTESTAGRLVTEQRLDPSTVPAGRHHAEPRARLDPSVVHTVVFTSGTGGRARPVALTVANHLASARASARALGTDPADRWLCPLPLFHVGGLAVLLRSAVAVTTAVLSAGFDADAARQALEQREITLASLVPTMLHRLRDAGLRRAPALRAALLGGGPIPAELLEWARELRLPVAPTYGMTETASQIATVPPREALRGERWARPLDGVELRIGDGGEILVRGPMVASGATGPEGWLRTGDLGSLDARGRLRVEGRVKDIVVTGGENVMATEVEEALRAHPAIIDAGVAGLPDPEWGELVGAFVVVSGEVSDEALRHHCRERLAPFAVPREIHRVPELPRNPAGKLLRRELRRPSPPAP